MVCVSSWQHKRRRRHRLLVSVADVCSRMDWRVNTKTLLLKTSIYIFQFSKHTNVVVNGISSLFKMLRELHFCENWGYNSDIDENSPSGIWLHLHGQRIFDIVIYTLLSDEYSNLMQFESIFYLVAAVTMAEWFSKWNYMFGYKWHRAIIYVWNWWGYCGCNLLYFVRYEVLAVMLMRISLVWDARFHRKTDLLSK